MNNGNDILGSNELLGEVQNELKAQGIEISKSTLKKVFKVRDQKILGMLERGGSVRDTLGTYKLKETAAGTSFGRSYPARLKAIFTFKRKYLFRSL